MKILIIENLVTKLKYSIQRMRKGYCDYDVFAINHWFLKIMPQMLTDLQKNRRSFPEVLAERYVEKHRGNIPYQEYYDKHLSEIEEFCNNEWGDILDKMIAGFTRMETIHYTYGKEADEEKARLQQENLSLFLEWFYNLYW